MTPDPPPRTLHIGLDEAGYGPNLGPLTITAVCAEVEAGHTLDLWRDLASSIDRAGGRPERLWVDDSKQLLHGRLGFDRLESAALATISAVLGSVPTTFEELLVAVGAGGSVASEVDRWLDAAMPRVPSPDAGSLVSRALRSDPFAHPSFRLTSLRSAVVGPSAFNAALDRLENKATAHADFVLGVLRAMWCKSPEGANLSVRCDKLGGRHDYLAILARHWADARIEPRERGPEMSRYVVDHAASGRRLEIRFTPRADAEDGLVALASCISKYLRERWMMAFNAFWQARVPGLRRTAGYPVDASRFRREIEAEAGRMGLDPALWWRRK